MANPLRIGIVGDFDRGKHSHWATDAAIFHAAARLGFAVETFWVPTESLDCPDGEKRSFDPNEINSLEISLDRIASGLESAGVVVNGAKQIIAERP